VPSPRNKLAEEDEHRRLCEFAIEQGAEYVLMNPLSSMGRGARSKAKLEAPVEQMRRIQAFTAPLAAQDLDVVHIGSRTTRACPWPAARRAGSSTSSSRGR
jgi:hypothetical protein